MFRSTGALFRTELFIGTQDQILRNWPKYFLLRVFGSVESARFRRYDQVNV